MKRCPSSRARRHFLAVLALFLCFLGLASAQAESIASLKKKLLTHKDFRVRTRAALALGKTSSKKAVSPLCKGLSDDKSTVRAACAAALGKLALGGKSCLEKRLGKESKSNVKKMIRKAIKRIKEAQTGPRLNSSTKYYVAVGKTKGDGGTGRAAMKRNLAERDGYAIAPEGETKAQAKKRLRKHPSVHGYYFAPVLTVERSSDSLKVTLDLAIYDYPDKSQLGSASRTMGRTGEGSDDKELEAALIRKVTDQLMSDFARLAEDA